MPRVVVPGPDGPQVFEHVCPQNAATADADAAPAPFGYVLVELERINKLCAHLKNLIDAGSADAKSLAAEAALLLEARRG